MSKMDFREILERDGRLVYTNRGDSMLPLIREGRDLVVIEPIREPLRKYDVPLYRRDSGEYVLHRILKIRPDGYVMCGDNRWRREKGVPPRQMIGVLTAVIRDGKTISVKDRKYRIYARIWGAGYPARVIALRARGLLRRIRRFRRKREA